MAQATKIKIIRLEYDIRLRCAKKIQNKKKTAT